MHVLGIMTVLTIGDFELRLSTIIAAVVAIALLALTLVLIVKDIKKQGKGADGETENSARSGEKGKRAAKRSETTETSDESPFTRLLGFDPYSPVECSPIVPDEDVEQCSEDMRILRERMQVAKQSKEKIAALTDRGERVDREIEKLAKAIRDNNVVASSSEAVGDKLRGEVGTLSATKKSARKNKGDIARLNDEIAANTQMASSVNAMLTERNRELKLLEEAKEYIAAEIARSERDLGFINSDIARLNATVGDELRRAEAEKRAREIESKLAEIKPVLAEVNEADAEIRVIDARLGDIADLKRELSDSLSSAMDRLKNTIGAVESGDVSGKVNEINRKLVKANDEEESLITRRNGLTRAFQVARERAYAYVEKENCPLDELVIAEDAILGEIELASRRAELGRRKNETSAAYTEAQSRYDELSAKKIKFRSETERRSYEERMSEAIERMRAARAESEKIKAELDQINSATPSSLVESGSGVISRELLAKTEAVAPPEPEKQSDEECAYVEKTEKRDIPQPSETKIGRDYARGNDFGGFDYRGYEPRDYDYRPRRSAGYYGGYDGRSSDGNLPAAPVDNATLAKMLNRLRELEAVAERGLRVRAASGYPSRQSKIERRKAQVVAIRKNLRYVDGPATAAEFKHKLYTFSLSLDEDEMNDPVLTEMIRRTMDEATALGERNGRN